MRATDGAAPGPLPLAQRVLHARGVLDADRAEAFLHPSLAQLHDPSLIPDLDRAAERLLAAATGDEPIVIYGDYDVDGMTATAILFHTLRAIAPRCRVSTYVPHRLEEGYGLNAEALTSLAAQGAKVIVSVDCGITAVEPARAARAAGVDVIITDHHNPPENEADLPEAYAVVHPRRPGSAYPFGELCGAGVAYKLAWRLCTLRSGSERVLPHLRELLIELLAPAALGVIADVVPLVDENRVLARFGLARIKKSPLIGLRALVEAAGLTGEDIDAEKVGFVLAPRLNACGRMGHAAEAVAMLTTAAADHAAVIAQDLCRQNETRRATERAIFEQAAEMAEAAGMTGPDRRAIVLAHEDWHPGVVGIVCSRLVERYARPVVLLQKQPGKCGGSGRSIDGFNLHAALAACAGHLDTFGGHDMAAGLKLRPEKLDAFTEAFVAHANGLLAPESLTHTLHIDCDAVIGDLQAREVHRLGALAPFGRENGRPLVRLHRARVTRCAPFGRDGSHVNIDLTDEHRPEVVVRAVGWRWAEQWNQHRGALREGARVEAVVTPKIEVWNGRESVRPVLEDLRVAP